MNSFNWSHRTDKIYLQDYELHYKKKNANFDDCKTVNKTSFPKIKSAAESWIISTFPL